MAMFARLISMLLVLVLAGGAQACVALCAPPAHGAADAPDRVACRRCGSENRAAAAPDRPSPAPCKHCQTAFQDRVATGVEHGVKASVDFTTPAPALVAVPTCVVDLLRPD